MKVENQVCTYDQAVKLQELGLKQCAAFYYVKTCAQTAKNIGLFFGREEAIKQYNKWVIHDEFLSAQTYGPVAAWNAAELGEVLPPELKLPRDTVALYTTKRGELWYCSLHAADLLKQMFFNEAQARAAMLIYLLENNHAIVEELNLQLITA